MATSFTFEELADGRKGASAGSGGRKLARAWDCWTDGTPQVSTEPAVITALGALLGIFRGVPHPDFTSCLCDEITADIDDATPQRWVIKATYLEPQPVGGTVPGGNPATHSDGQTNNPEPTDRPPVFKVAYQRVAFSKETDRAGVPYKNPAGDWFESFPQQTEGMTVLKVTKWYQDWDIPTGGDYLDNINSNSWVTRVGTFDQYKCKIEGIEAEYVTELGGRAVWKVDFTIWAYSNSSDHAWYPTRILNQGRNEIDASGNKVPARDKATGQPLNGIVLLKADGTQLPTGDGPTYSEFDDYIGIDFHGALGIG